MIPTNVDDLTRPAAEHGRVSTDEAGELAIDALLVRPNHPFYMVFYPDHPGNWDAAVISGDESDEATGTWWLPTLQRDPAQPGVNGYRTTKKGDRPGHAKAQAHELITSDGGIVLPLSLGYRVELDCIDPRSKTPGTFYTDAWSEPRPKIRGQRLKHTFDRERYNRWRLMLVREGYVPAPDPQLLDINRARMAVRIERREALRDLPDERRVDYVAEAEAAAAIVDEAKVPEVSDAPRPAYRKPAAPKAPARKATRKTSAEPKEDI